MNCTDKLVLVGALLGLTAGCAPSIEHVGTEVSEVCVRGIPLWFNSSGDTAVARFSFADAGLYMDELAGGTITLDSVVLTAGPEVGDLGFADSVAVRLPGGQGAPDVALAQAPGVGAEQSLYLGGDPAADLTEHLLTQETMEVTVYGQAPAQRWSASVDVCLAVDGLDSQALP